MQKENKNEVSQRHEKIRAEIAALTGISINERFDMMFNNAETYLKLYCGKDVYAFRTLHGSRTFWRWWINQWALRDTALLESQGINLLLKGTLQQLYAMLHCPQSLVCEIYPPKVVWQQAESEEITALLTSVNNSLC